MKFKDYLHSTRRTWNDKEDYSDNISHALLGLYDEVGELCKGYKKALVDDKELDKTNVIEEMGDFMYFFARAIDTLQYEKLDSICEGIDTILNGEANDSEKITEISVALSLGYHAGNLYFGIASNKHEVSGQSIQEIAASINILSKRLGITPTDVMEANDRKLRTRYKDKYSEEESANRDPQAEREAIEKDEEVSSPDSK